MNERLHASLDGELKPEDLTPSERVARAAFDARVDAMRTELGRRTPRDMDAAVMSRIRDLGLEPLPAESASVARRVAGTLWTTRDVRFRVRPVYGLAVAALLAAVLMSGGALMRSLGQPADAQQSRLGSPVASGPIYVQFRLEAVAASNVSVAGSFSDWQPTYRMQQTGDGMWTALLPLSPGVHDYGFIVDGVDGEQWMADPYAPQIDDGFGGVNSRLTVLLPANGL